MTYSQPHTLREPAAEPGISATARVLEELQLYGYHPGADEPDPRPLPDAATLDSTVACMFEILAETFQDTRLEPDTADILWHLADIFHRKSARVQAQLDDNETKQRSAQDDQDGSEIRSVELEKLINEGGTLMERRNAFEMMRDTAASHYEALTGSSWRPRAGSMVNRKKQTAAIIDSRDFIAAKKLQETGVMIPPGTRIAFSGGAENLPGNTTARIWAVLDRALERHPDMVLLHTNAPGADKIAGLWARNRNVTQIPFDPDWNLKKASVFKRNDRLLEAEPLYLVAFTGSGITDNLVDKAKKRGGIKIVDCRKKA